MFWFFITIGILLLIFVVYQVAKDSLGWFQTPQRPQSATGYKPSVRAVTPPEEDFQVVHRGKGSLTTESVYLNPIIYRLEYQFPTDGKAKLELISADGSITKTLVEKAGFGNTTFRVTIGKYYVFRITPQSPDSEWALVIKNF